MVHNSSIGDAFFPQTSTRGGIYSIITIFFEGGLWHLVDICGKKHPLYYSQSTIQVWNFQLAGNGITCNVLHSPQHAQEVYTTG